MILNELFELTREHADRRAIDKTSALWQDLGIIGEGSDDFVLALVQKYGDWVGEWPWERYISFNEAIPMAAPFRALWKFLRLPWIETAFPRLPELERLELGHMAAVIEKGHWFDP